MEACLSRWGTFVRTEREGFPFGFEGRVQSFRPQIDTLDMALVLPGRSMAAPHAVTSSHGARVLSSTSSMPCFHSETKPSAFRPNRIVELPKRLWNILAPRIDA